MRHIIQNARYIMLLAAGSLLACAVDEHQLTTELSVGGGTNVAGASNVGGRSSVGGSSATDTLTTVGGNTNVGGAPSAGGETNAGGSPSVGGETNAGGGSNAGGSSSTGTSTSVGGATNVGGETNVAGASVGGEPNIGGATSAVGGATDVGGSSSAGGTESVGGETSTIGGATSAVGGATDVGGSSSAGGTESVGGETSTAGGATNVGGTESVGGETSTVGGATSVGGETSTVGGATSVGGETSTVGGATSIGGETSTGGTTSTVPLDCKALTGAMPSPFCTVTNGTVDFTQICATGCDSSGFTVTGTSSGLTLTGSIYPQETVFRGNPVQKSTGGGDCAGFAAVNPQTLQPYTSMVISITNSMSTDQLIRVDVTDYATGSSPAEYVLGAAVPVAAGQSITETLKWPGVSCNSAADCMNFVPMCVLGGGAAFDPLHLRYIGLAVGDPTSTQLIDNLNIKITSITFN